MQNAYSVWVWVRARTVTAGKVRATSVDFLESEDETSMHSSPEETAVCWSESSLPGHSFADSSH